MPRSATGEVLQVLRGRSQSAPPPPNGLQMAKRRFIALGGDIKQALAAAGPEAGRIRELAVQAGKLIEAGDTLALEQALQELDTLLERARQAPVLDTAGKERWEGQAALRSEVNGKLQALEGWAVDGASALRLRLDTLLAQATDEQNAYSKAADGLDALRVDVAQLHSAESNRRKQSRQESREQDARELDEKGSGLPELFARDDYEKAAAVQEPRVEEVKRRCGPVPGLSSVLAPVTQGWDKVQEAVRAENFLSAHDLLAALLGPIDTALAAAAKDEVIKKRLALEQYAAALAIADTPPPGDVLKAEVDEFRAKEKTVTDAEAADNPVAAENGHAALGVAAKALVAAHGLWDAYSKVHTEAVKKQVEAADLIVTAAAPELTTQIVSYDQQRTLWDTAVKARTWQQAADQLKVLAQRAKVLVDAEAAWKPYGAAFTGAIRQDETDASSIWVAKPPALKSWCDAYLLAWQPWNTAVKKAAKDGSWAAAATKVPALAAKARDLIDQHGLWKAYCAVANSTFVARRREAIDIYKENCPDLTALSNEFAAKHKDWDDLLGVDPIDWAAAKDAADELRLAADALITEFKRLTDAFDNAYKGATKASIKKAAKRRDENLPALAAATRVFAPVYDTWQADQDANRLVAATAGVATVANAATAYNLAYDQFDIGWQDFDTNKLSAVANYDDAVRYCERVAGSPPIDQWPPEPRAFTQADFVMDEARRNADWVAAEASLTPLKAAIAKVVPAYENWMPFAVRSFAAAPSIEKARLAAASAPPGVATEKNAFETEANKIDPAVKGKNWVAALNAVNQAEPLAKALLTAVANLAKLRVPFDKALASGAAAVKQAQAVVKALPPGLAGNDKVLAFTGAEQKVKEAEQAAVADSAKWPQALLAAQDLATKAQAVVSAAGTLNAGVTEEDRNRFKEQLKALDPRVKKADESWMFSPHIQKLQEAAKAARLLVDNTLGTDFLDAAGPKYDALVAALDAMEKAKAAYNLFKERFDEAEQGPVRQALDGGDDPAALAEIRDKQLESTKQRIMKVASTGQVTLATRMVATWEEEARGWKDKWAEAQRAHAALNNPPPDEAALKALADAPGGGKVFDDLVASLPADTTQADVFSKAMKARFGVDFKQYKKQQDEVHALEATPGTAPDKSVKQLYKLMASVPDAHVKGALERVTRYTDDDDGGDYGAALKQMNLYCGRAGSRSGGDTVEEEALVDPKELPEVDEDCQPVEGPAPKQFNWTSLHEVGHAIDDALGFMNARRGDARFGGWLTSSIDDAAEAAAGKFGYDKDYIAKVLANKGKPLAPDKRPEAPDVETPARKLAREAAESWCALVVEDGDLWWKGGSIPQAEIDGRVYQQAYASEWYSYPAAARRQGITGYQFRSPAEWFAELYAGYYAKKLKESHPAVSWLKELQRPGA